MKNKLSTIAIIILALFTVLNFSYSTQAVNNTKNIAQKLNDNPPKIVYVQAKDGYTPIKGKDYGDGAPGINAVSYAITNNVIKEVPLVGEPGKDGDAGLPGRDGANGQDGKDAPTQEIRVNEDNKNIQTKMSNWDDWSTLIYCSEYRVECP